MRTELLLKRDNGDRVKIAVHLRGFGGETPLYTTNVYSCKKGKRTWVSAVDTDCFRYRATPFASPEREFFVEKLKLKVVTEAEINQAKIQLWESVHPSKQTN
jgi:hypothetical protein